MSNVKILELDEAPKEGNGKQINLEHPYTEWKYCLLYTSPSPRDATLSRMPSSA